MKAIGKPAWCRDRILSVARGCRCHLVEARISDPSLYSVSQGIMAFLDPYLLYYHMGEDESHEQLADDE